MNNLEKLELFGEMKKKSVSAGGKDNISKQHKSGKKTARERLATLFDEGTFAETDSFLKNRNPISGSESYADGVVAGYGTVNERLVYAYAQDFTVLSGSISEMNCKKIKKVYDLAKKTGAPVVSVIDCNGVRLEDGLDALCSYNDIMRSAVELSGLVPQISVICGNCAGSMTFVPAVSDFTFMVKDIANMYISSKEVLKANTGESDELFPTSAFCAENGSCDVSCESEEEAFLKVKTLLSFLPSNYLEDTQAVVTDDINRACDSIINYIPSDDKTGFDIRDIIKIIADNYDIFEVKENYAKNMVTAFIRLGGYTVGVIANQSLVDNGVIDSDAAKKAAGFVNFCDSFDIPVLSLTDSEGFKISLEAEKNNLIKDIAKLGFAFASSDVAKVNVVIRKAYGSAYLYMNSKQMGADFSYALPTAIITGATPEVALNMLMTDQISKYKDPISGKEELMEKYRNEIATPYEAAKRGYIDDVIDPVNLRSVLISAFDVLASKRAEKCDKKHGNMPV